MWFTDEFGLEEWLDLEFMAFELQDVFESVQKATTLTGK